MNNFKDKIVFKLISLLVIFSLGATLPVPVITSNAFAQSALNLPAPGTMITPSVGYTPPIMAGMTIYPDNPLKFDFIITAGDDGFEGEAFRKESKKLINYFLATLTVPDDEMWVNLSPYEKDRIIAEGLGATEMGRDMLIQDYMLKQFTASLMYPEEEFGDKFWKKVYKKVQARFGTAEIPANTFNKVWIVPEEAVVYVNGTNVFVSESHLKVMLEEDYLALESNQDSTSHGLGEMTKGDIEVISQDAKEIIREVIIPEIEREVNEGRNFASLRQIYHSMILATWYKKNLSDSILGNVYMDKNKVDGIDLKDRQIKEKIYEQYVEAFKKGVYDYIREDYDEATQEIIPRKYFSGGLTRQESVVEGEGLSPSSEIAKAARGESVVRTVGVEANPTDSNGDVIDAEQTADGDNAMLSLEDAKAEVKRVLARHDLSASLSEFNRREDTFTWETLASLLAKAMSNLDIQASRAGEESSGVYSKAMTDLVAVALNVQTLIEAGRTVFAATEESTADLVEAEEERQYLLGSLHITFDRHDRTIHFVDMLAERMKDKDVVFVEVNRRMLWLNFERILNQIARGEMTPEQALKDSLLLRFIVRVDKAPMFGSHLKALMEALHKAYQLTGRKRTVVTEHYRNKKLWKRTIKAVQKFKEVEAAIYAGDLEEALRMDGEAYEEMATTSAMRDNDYVERLKTSFQDTPGQRALLVRGAAHTEVFIELKRNYPEIEVTRDFLGERNFDFSLGSALLRKMTFQKEGLLPELPISDLERVQGLFSSMIVGIGNDTLKADAFDFRTINKITKRMDSMELMKKLFDDVKQAKITELKKNQRENAFNYFLVRWILSQGLATPIELAKAWGGDILEQFIALLGDEDVSAQQEIERILDRLAKYRLFSGENLKLLEKEKVRIEKIGGTIKITMAGNEDADTSAYFNDGRGWDGLPNDVYTDGIRTALIDTNFASLRLQKLDAQVDPVVVQTGFELDSDIRNESGREKAAGIISPEQQVKLRPEQLVRLANVIRQMGIQNQLQDTTLVFIPGQSAHYSVGRNQIFLDAELLNNRAELQMQLNHEFTERNDVLEGLSDELRVELEITARTPEARSPQLVAEITRLAEQSHARLKEEEGRVGGIDFNPRIMNLRESGQRVDFDLNNIIFQNIQPNSVQGILPVIINITPVTNFVPLIGGLAIE